MAIHTVTTHAQLLTAISAAVYGDEIRCQAGTTFHESTGTGSYQFPVKTGYTAGATILVTTTATTGLPDTGHRTNPSYAALMPTLQSRQADAYQNEPSIYVLPGAKGWTFRHIRILQTFYGSGSAVRIGSNSTNTQYKKSQQPEAITFDRCYFAAPNQYWGGQRGLEAHGKSISCTNSYFDPIGTPGPDTQNIWCLNGEGPYTITNNFLGGATINFLTGGADAGIETEAVIGASPAPTTSSAFVSWAASAHPDADPPVPGQHIALVTTNGTIRRHAFVTAYTASTSSSGTVTFTTREGSPGFPLSELPTVGGDIRWGAIPSNITFEHNLVEQPAAWFNRILPTPSNVTLTAQTGGFLDAGTYGVRVASRKILQNEITGSSTAIGTPEATNTLITVTAGQQIVVTWAAAADAESYRVYVTLPDGSVRWVSTGANVLTATFPSMTSGTLITSGIPSGADWIIKNLWELKVGINVECANNIFRQLMTGKGGTGYAWWIKSVNQSGGGEFNWTAHVEMHHNVMYDTHGVLSTSAREFAFSGAQQHDRPGQLDDLYIHDNVCYKTIGTIWSRGATTNWGLSLTGGTRIRIDHNTFIHTDEGCLRLLVNQEDDNWLNSPVWTNNLFRRNDKGVLGQNQDLIRVEGTQSLDVYSRSTYSFTNNAIAGVNPSQQTYPAGNLFPTVAAFEAWFVDYPGFDFTLAAGSGAIGAGTGGSDLGADVAAVNTAVANVLTGRPPVGPPPSITSTSPLPTARVGQSYSHTLTATDGTLPYTWGVDAGALPVGLTLATTGAISGIPTVAGDATFTARVADANLNYGFKVFVLPVALPLGPTRYYFPSSGAPDVVPKTVSSGWTNQTLAASEILPLTTVKRGTPMVLARRTASGPNPSYTILRQYVGPSLAKQLIGGTFKMQIRCGENAAGLNATLAVCIRIVNASGDEVAILSNGGSPIPVASSDTATTPPEFPAITLGANQEKNRRLRDADGLVAIPLVEYETANGDRPVIEIGYRDASTSTSASAGVIIGDSGSSDLPEGDA